MKPALTMLAMFFIISLCVACDTIAANPKDALAGMISILSLFGLVLSSIAVVEKERNENRI